jgi:Nuclease-related domain
MAEWERQRRAYRARALLCSALAIAAGVLVVGAVALVLAPGVGGVVGRLGGPASLATAGHQSGRHLAAWPIVVAAVAALGAALGALACWPRSDPDRWHRGADGEVATAATLDRLASRHWLVRHDLGVPGSRANIDHLVIGPSGVWVIDSKSFRARLRARRGELWAGQTRLSTQAVRWEAKVVSNLLGAPSTPLVAVHGRGLRRRGAVSGGVRVVPAGSVCRRLRRHRYLRPELSPARVAELGLLADARLRGLRRGPPGDDAR